MSARSAMKMRPMGSPVEPGDSLGDDRVGARVIAALGVEVRSGRLAGAALRRGRFAGAAVGVEPVCSRGIAVRRSSRSRPP